MINGLKDRLNNISSSAKKIVLASVSAIMLLTMVVSGVCICHKKVLIIDGNGLAKEVSTFKRYVEDVLDAEGVTLGSLDELSFPKEAALKDNMIIQIYRAFPVMITENGNTVQRIATRYTAGEALKVLGYELGELDEVYPKQDKRISSFDEITIVRVEEKTIEVTEEIPYESKERENKTLASGARKLVQKGVPGEKTVSYKVRIEDGEEVSREKLTEEIKVSPVAQIKEVGPKKKPTANYQIASAGTVQTSRSGSLSYSKVIAATATAYDASSCGKSPSHPAYGITATGARAGYGIVAVDPRVIPLGSRLYIETTDGSYIYGTAVAADTGGAIKGNRVDLCFNTRQEAINFGRKSVKIYILK